MGHTQQGSSGNKGKSVDMRRSPRTYVRKTRMSSGSIEQNYTPEKKNSRKRKAVVNEDDPSYSEEEELESDPGKQKKVV